MTLALLAVLAAASNPNAFDAEIAAAIDDVSDVHPVPPALVRAVIQVESGGRPDAISRAGAIGLMQLMPETARKVGVAPEELALPARNILAGVRLLAVLLLYYDDRLVDVLVAYNAGPRSRAAPIPENGETPEYVRRVLEQFRALSATDASATSTSTPSAP